MQEMSIANGGLLWILCAALIGAVILQTLIFMRKGWKQALALGVPTKQLWKTVTASITVSILPSIPIILILFLMLPIMGMPVPWLRLTIIGSAGYEMMAASMGVAASGQKFGIGTFSKEAFISALWVMTVGGSAATFVTLCILRPITSAYERFKKTNTKAITIFGLCCLTGVLGSVFAQYGTKSLKAAVVTVVSAASAIAMIKMARRFENLKWLNDFNMALSMIIGMAAAILVP